MEAYSATAPTLAAAGGDDAPPGTAMMATLQRIRAIEAAIADLRPYLRADGGDCELLDVDGDRVLVKLRGACIGCQMARVTVNGIQQRLIAKLGAPLRVIPVPAG
jgi:NifU-like protein